jgi:hypothetical protein
VTQLLDLFLRIAPWVALAGGLTLAATSVLGLRGGTFLVPELAGRALPALAALLLGLALAGMGATYLLTAGAVGYSTLYLAWLALAALSGLLGLVSGRS